MYLNLIVFDIKKGQDLSDDRCLEKSNLCLTFYQNDLRTLQYNQQFVVN